jgi:putative ABC transport system substrate-binding protein
MAMKRRQFLLALPLLASACAVESVRPSLPAATQLGGRAHKGAGKPTVLVLMPDTKQTREVWSGIKDELEGRFTPVVVEVGGDQAKVAIARAMSENEPACVVLMNNPTVHAYAEYQSTARLAHYPPAVVVMTSFLDRRPGIADATGISYEVPLITVVTNLRKLMSSPVERVGVIRRTVLHPFVQRQAELAHREQIAVVEQSVSMDPNAAELRYALRELKQRCDAIWILNDDHLLSQRLIAEGWLPGLNERPYKPTIVGAASLVSPGQSFGTFAVLPDHTALGVQTANLVFDIADAGFSLEHGDDVALPVSTTTTVDLIQARERFALRQDALEHVDHILE